MHTIIPAPLRTRAQHLTEGFIFAALLFVCAVLAWRNPANRFILALLALVVIVAILRLFFDRCAVPLCIEVDRDTIRITRHRYWRLRPQTRDYPLRLFSGVGSYVRADAFENAALFTVLLPQLPGQPSLRLGHHLLSLREEPSDLTAAAALRAEIAQYSGLPDRGLVTQPAGLPPQEAPVEYAPQYHGKERLRQLVPFILLVCIVLPCGLLTALLLRDDAYRCLVFTPLTAALFFLVAPIAATIFLVRQIIPPALRALRSGQYPPPGEKTLVRTRIRYGRAARISIWLELVLIPLWALFLLAGSVPALYQIAGKPCPAAGSQQAQAGIYSAAAIREKPAM
jgi:membrane protein